MLNSAIIICYSRVHGACVQKRQSLQRHLLSDAHQQFSGTQSRAIVSEILAQTAAEVLNHR